MLPATKGRVPCHRALSRSLKPAGKTICLWKHISSYLLLGLSSSPVTYCRQCGEHEYVKTKSYQYLITYGKFNTAGAQLSIFPDFFRRKRLSLGSAFPHFSSLIRTVVGILSCQTIGTTSSQHLLGLPLLPALCVSGIP